VTGKNVHNSCASLIDSRYIFYFILLQMGEPLKRRWCMTKTCGPGRRLANEQSHK